jgi:flagellar basal body-associated protein FliL
VAAKPTSEGHDVNTRASDPPIKITREIPLYWVLSVVAAIVGQGALVWFTQKSQGDLIAQQNESIKQLTAELRAVTTDLNTGRVKDLEHDLKIADHERRLATLEKR